MTGHRFRLPGPLRRGLRTYQVMRAVRQNSMRWPPGHYYSPIPSLDAVRADEARIFTFPHQLPGIDLRLDEQLGLIEKLSTSGADQPFDGEKVPALRYYFENGSFGYGDGIVLHSMLRHLRPRRLIEIGGGFSSALILDTNDLFLDNSLHCTFIEPYPDLLLSLLRPNDLVEQQVLSTRIQDVDLAFFRELRAGDVLFVDSTHVAKVGSDVNHIFFAILPILQPGVVVHFHDIMFPFEYEPKWIYTGIAWNEAYMLRTFLMYNSAFKILLFNSFLAHLHREQLLKAFPLYRHHGGGSIWIERTADASG